MKPFRGSLPFRNAAATTHTMILGSPPVGDVRYVTSIRLATNGALTMTNFGLYERSQSAGTLVGTVFEYIAGVALTAYKEFSTYSCAPDYGVILTTNNTPYLWASGGNTLEFGCTFGSSLPITVWLDYY